MRETDEEEKCKLKGEANPDGVLSDTAIAELIGRDSGR